MQYQLRYTYILFTFLFLLLMPAEAANNLACETFEQKNVLNNPWVCPDLGSKLDTVLSDVDVESGNYVCEYYYPSGGALASTCSYHSEIYKEKLDKTLAELHTEIVNAITTESGRIPEMKKFKFLTSNPFPLPSNSELEAIENTIRDHEGNVTSFFGEFKTLLPPLSTYYHNIADAHYYMEELKSTPGPKDKITKSETKFVNPYESGLNSGSVRNTFSNFIMGMVTLDKDVIEGYDSNGSPVLTSTWTTTKSDHPALPKNEKNATSELNTDLANINEWVDIFKQKVWGFYYNLQRRFDLGFDIISTQLLFIMMVFFAMIMATRGGARYITNRENGHSSGEIKVNEASIMKTLAILATVFTFYISVPYTDKSTPETKIQTNGSLSKELIQYAMEEGSNFGTMMADLGTDAFLNHIVHKQGLDNTEKDNVIASMMSMAYYFPAVEILNVCRIQSGMPDDVIASGANQYAHSQYFEENYEKDIKFTKNNSDGDTQMVGIDEQLCAKMFGRIHNKLQKILADFEGLNGMIKADQYVRAQATASLVGNHIKMQEALGWMNIASVPYTYFMMRYQHLFYQPTLDYNTTYKISKNYVENLGLRNQKDTLDDTLWIKNKTEVEGRVADAKSVAEKNRAEFSRFAVYNFLPGFTSIRNELLQRMQSLYSDILRLSQKGDTGKLEAFKDEVLFVLIEKARNYSPNMEGLGTNFIDKLKKQVEDGIGIGSTKKTDPVELHKAFIKISYFAGMAIWKSGFIIVFLSAIAMIIGLKIVLYVINVMVHFFISPFIVVWAFATSTDNGMAKIKNYLRDTLIYMLYPTIIVVGVFVFIFAYELFYSIYGFITSMLIESQMLSIEEAITAANMQKSPASFSTKDGEMGYMAIYALKDITEILIDLLSVYVAFLTINKFPELVLKMMGVGDSAVMMLPQASEAIQSKGGGNVNPLSR